MSEDLDAALKTLLEAAASRSHRQGLAAPVVAVIGDNNVITIHHGAPVDFHRGEGSDEPRPTRL
jgi:hypothetical protein